MNISIGKIIYRISSDISWYGTKYRTSFRTSYQWRIYMWLPT